MEGGNGRRTSFTFCRVLQDSHSLCHNTVIAHGTFLLPLPISEERETRKSMLIAFGPWLCEPAIVLVDTAITDEVASH